MQIENKNEKIIWKDPGRRKVCMSIGITCLLGSLCVFLRYDDEGCVEMQKTVDEYMYGFWAIGPPLWFFYEYVSMVKDGQGEEFERYLSHVKYCQELAAKVWAGVIVCMGVIFLSRYEVSIG